MNEADDDVPVGKIRPSPVHRAAGASRESRDSAKLTL